MFRALASALLALSSLAGPLAAQRIVETPAPQAAPYGVTVDRFHGRWYTYSGGMLGKNDGYYDVQYSSAGALTIGPDGAVWFTEPAANRIFRYRFFDPSPITPFVIPTLNAGVSGIASGPDGNIWFTEENGNKIGRLTPTGTFKEFPIPSSNSSPERIAMGTDGNLWFTEFATSMVGRITPEGFIDEYATKTPSSHPFGIAAGNGYVVFTEQTGNRIGRILPGSSPVLDEVSIPTPVSNPAEMALGSDGTFYFTEYLGNKIGRYDAPQNAVIEEIPIPTLSSHPLGIAAAHDGDILFTESTAAKLGRLRLRVPGDANGDGHTDVQDVFFLVNFLFAGGAAPK
jgi:virginiamycin B lyase